MPRTVQDIVDHGDELAKRFEDYEPRPGDARPPDAFAAWPDGSRAVPPREHAPAVEREPHGRLAGRHVDLEPHAPRVTTLLQPGAVGAAGGADRPDRVGEPRIGRSAVVQRRRAEVVRRAEHASWRSAGDEHVHRHGRPWSSRQAGAGGRQLIRLPPSCSCGSRGARHRLHGPRTPRDGRACVTFVDTSGATTRLWVDESYSSIELFTGDSLPDLSRRRRSLGVEE